jgi:hypothetical protein
MKLNTDIAIFRPSQGTYALQGRSNISELSLTYDKETCHVSAPASLVLEWSFVATLMVQQAINLDGTAGHQLFIFRALHAYTHTKWIIVTQGLPDLGFHLLLFSVLQPSKFRVTPSFLCSEQVNSPSHAELQSCRHTRVEWRPQRMAR